MERIFHHYNKWEDYHAGMYDECKEGRAERVIKAAEILGTPDICRKAMEKVVAEWKIATEYNFSNAEINRKAWLGQAACSCYAGIHEDETREAWGIMTESQRIEANSIASDIIKKWLDEREQKENPQISMFNDWGNIF
jgi:hypothetical protein